MSAHAVRSSRPGLDPRLGFSSAALRALAASEKGSPAPGQARGDDWGELAVRTEPRFSDTSHIPRGKYLAYLCRKCGMAISSGPKENGGCECSSIFIDKDYNRLCVDDFEAFLLVDAETLEPR